MKAFGSNGRIPSRSLTQQLVAHLSNLIGTGALAPGEKLAPESEIVRQQGVSRTVVREAISQLQAAGLVTKRHGIGTFVLDSVTRQIWHQGGICNDSPRCPGNAGTPDQSRDRSGGIGRDPAYG